MAKEVTLLTTPVTASPILNKRLVNREVNDPALRANEPEKKVEQPQTNASPDPQPQQSQPHVDPGQSTDQQAQPTESPESGQSSDGTEHLSEAGKIRNEEVPEMEFPEIDPSALGGDEDSYGGSHDSSPGTSSDVGFSGEQSKIFSKIIGELTGNIVIPKLTGLIAKIKIKELREYVRKGLVDPRVIEVVEKINHNTEERLKLSDEEIKMLVDALDAYIKYKKITAANPESALIATLITLLISQGGKAIQIGQENKMIYKQMLTDMGIDRMQQQQKQQKADPKPKAEPQQTEEKEKETEKS